MTILHGAYALCECGEREFIDGDEYPARWPEMTLAAGVSQHFCSETCLIASAQGLPRGLRPKFGLTDRQIEVLYLAAQGYTNKEIAVQLRLASSSVKNSLQRIFEVLHTPTRVEAIFRAHHLGILNVSQTSRLCSDRLMGRVA